MSTVVAYALPLVIPLAVLGAFWLFANLIKRRRREGRQYEFHHPLSGAYGGGVAEGSDISPPDSYGLRRLRRSDAHG